MCLTLGLECQKGLSWAGGGGLGKRLETRMEIKWDNRRWMGKLAIKK